MATSFSKNLLRLTGKTRGGKNSRDAIRVKADGYSYVSKIENDYRLSIWKAKVEVRLERGKSKSLGDTTLYIVYQGVGEKYM